MKRLEVFDLERCIGCQLCMFACSRRFGAGGISKSSIMVSSAGGISRGFKVVVCRACQDPPCAAVCPTEAIVKKEGGGIKFNPKKCIGCRFCVDACILGAVFWNDEEEKPTICIHCGYCVEYCPHGVLRLSEKEEVHNVQK